MRLFQDLSVYQSLAEQVARPNQLTSFLQLSRRAKVTDDTARRALERLKGVFNNPLIAVQNHRLTLTDTGHSLLGLAVKLSALADSTETPPDVLTVEADSVLAASLLPRALAAFLDMWGSMVQPKICPLLEEGARRDVMDGIASFGVGFGAGGETVPAAELLGPRVAWMLVLHKSHRLASDSDSVVAESLTLNDRVFMPEMAAEWPGMDGILKAVPAFNRIFCDGTLAVRLALAGFGAAIVPDLLDEPQLCKRVIGCEPVQPRFFLPHRGRLTEPEVSLVEQIRSVAEERCKQVAPPVETAAEVVVDVLCEEPARQMEGVLS